MCSDLVFPDEAVVISEMSRRLRGLPDAVLAADAPLAMRADVYAGIVLDPALGHELERFDKIAVRWEILRRSLSTQSGSRK